MTETIIAIIYCDDSFCTPGNEIYWLVIETLNYKILNFQRQFIKDKFLYQYFDGTNFYNFNTVIEAKCYIEEKIKNENEKIVSKF